MPENRIKELREIINYHSHLYYTMDESEISDFEYDALMQELKKLENEIVIQTMSLVRKQRKNLRSLFKNVK